MLRQIECKIFFKPFYKATIKSFELIFVFSSLSVNPFHLTLKFHVSVLQAGLDTIERQRIDKQRRENKIDYNALEEFGHKEIYTDFEMFLYLIIIFRTRSLLC